MDKRYTALYSMGDDYTLRQYTEEAEEEYIMMERSVEDILECERDAIQQMYEDLY